MDIIDMDEDKVGQKLIYLNKNVRQIIVQLVYIQGKIMKVSSNDQRGGRS